jgi:hypothetical protein
MNTVGRKRVVLGGVLLLCLVSCGPTRSFTIEGNAAEPISPGVRAPLDLKLTNPQYIPLSVTGVRVSVQAVRAPNADDAHPCTVGDFTVNQASSSIVIALAARATRTLSSLGVPPEAWPQVGLLDRPVEQDGCKGASVTLRYAASGRPGK